MTFGRYVIDHCWNHMLRSLRGTTSLVWPSVQPGPQRILESGPEAGFETGASLRCPSAQLGATACHRSAPVSAQQERKHLCAKDRVRASLREPLKASDIPDPSRQRVLRHKFFRCLWQGATCMADREHQRLLRLRFNQLQVHLWLHDLKKFIFHLGKQNFVMQTYSVACTEDASLCQHSTECKGDHLDKYIRTCRARLLCSEAIVRWFAGASSSPSGPGWC